MNHNFPRSTVHVSQARQKSLPRVLVIEDDPGTRSEMTILLVESGFECISCTSAEQAERLLRVRRDIAVAIVDLGLPGVSGLDLIARLRERPGADATRFIVATGNASLDAAMQALRLRVDDYILKPLDPEEIVTKVRHAAVESRTELLKGKLVATLAEETQQLSARCRSLERAARRVHAGGFGDDAESDVVRRIVWLISHELRTPLGPIIGYATQLKDNKVRGANPELADIGRSIYAEAIRLRERIDSIVDLARMEEGEREPLLAATNPVRLLMMIADVFLSACRERSIRLDLNVTSCPSEAILDKYLWAQAVSHVVRNAIEHSPDHGRVVLTAWAQGNELVCTVADEGQGMSEADVARVVRPFRQGDEGLARTKNGLGLGLPLAFRFISAHGGRLEVTSRSPSGTCVTIAVPLASDRTRFAA